MDRLRNGGRIRLRCGSNFPVRVCRSGTRRPAAGNGGRTGYGRRGRTSLVDRRRRGRCGCVPYNGRGRVRGYWGLLRRTGIRPAHIDIRHTRPCVGGGLSANRGRSRGADVPMRRRICRRRRTRFLLCGLINSISRRKVRVDAGSWRRRHRYGRDVVCFRCRSRHRGCLLCGRFYGCGCRSRG